MTSLEVFSDLSERLRYNHPDFPVYVRRGVLSHFEGYSAECHWHPDVEFLVILDGEMSYFINGKTVELRAGEGVFVNSERLHYGFATRGRDCRFLVVAFHPQLLAGNNPVVGSALAEDLGPGAPDFVKLSPSTGATAILENLRALESEMDAVPPPILRIFNGLVGLLAALGDLIGATTTSNAPVVHDKTWMTVWKMRTYIQQRYGSKITLEEIAQAGAVCRSRCCQLFARHLGESPAQFLTGYRISRACEMLRETTRSVSEVAQACGFQTTSYFSSVFRDYVGMTPSKYRAT